jgi:hypothetical protein
MIAEDIVIYGDDGDLYHITPEELEQFQVDKEDPQYEKIEQLIGEGVVISAAKTPKGDGTASEPLLPVLCYLINLASLRLKVPKKE